MLACVSCARRGERHKSYGVDTWMRKGLRCSLRFKETLEMRRQRSVNSSRTKHIRCSNTAAVECSSTESILHSCETIHLSLMFFVAPRRSRQRTRHHLMTSYKFACFECRVPTHHCCTTTLYSRYVCMCTLCGVCVCGCPCIRLVLRRNETPVRFVAE